ncbi:MAG: DUF7711 family protein [Pseudonocardiaceae bacterium]
MPWCSQPPGTAWLVDNLRLDKGGIAYWWRSRHEPVGNHVIRDPVRFWSLDGTDEAVLDTLRERRFADLPRLTASTTEVQRRTAMKLDRGSSAAGLVPCWRAAGMCRSAQGVAAQCGESDRL